MNPVEHPVRVLTILIAVVSVVFATAAFGAMHVVQDFNHGITGPSCGPALQNCTLRSEIYDWDGTINNANLAAGNYHWTGSRYNEQCYQTVLQATFVVCTGPSGTLPCQKYAFTTGQDPTSHLVWHGHNPASVVCA